MNADVDVNGVVVVDFEGDGNVDAPSQRSPSGSRLPFTSKLVLETCPWVRVIGSLVRHAA